MDTTNMAANSHYQKISIKRLIFKIDLSATHQWELLSKSSNFYQDFSIINYSPKTQKHNILSGRQYLVSSRNDCKMLRYDFRSALSTARESVASTVHPPLDENTLKALLDQARSEGIVSRSERHPAGSTEQTPLPGMLSFLNDWDMGRILINLGYWLLIFIRHKS